MTDETRSLPERRQANARVVSNRRVSSVVTLTGWNAVTFSLEIGGERTFDIQGEQGRFLKEGDQGTLSWRGGMFISFEKPDGETVGALYYLPPQGNGGSMHDERDG